MFASAFVALLVAVGAPDLCHRLEIAMIAFYALEFPLFPLCGFTPFKVIGFVPIPWPNYCEKSFTVFDWLAAPIHIKLFELCIGATYVQLPPTPMDRVSVTQTGATAISVSWTKCTPNSHTHVSTRVQPARSDCAV